MRLRRLSESGAIRRFVVNSSDPKLSLRVSTSLQAQLCVLVALDLLAVFSFNFIYVVMIVLEGIIC